MGRTKAILFSALINLFGPVPEIMQSKYSADPVSLVKGTSGFRLGHIISRLRLL